ncbi:MAG: hypothetical protein JXR77_02120 [Lentisphaeria bacterium]|nr:hypothetical protein [Lentisphaeria bacterium]
MHIMVSLTVSESKRLIARGIARSDVVRRVLESGVVAVGSGTTNGYVIEELTGERIDKHGMVTGRTLPADYRGPTLTYSGEDLVLRRGERVRGVKASEFIKEMGPGDVFLKGANAVNYERGQAGVLIGHPSGGTVGAILGAIVARRIRLLHPVGLEKSVAVDLETVAAQINRDAQGKGPTLWIVPGTLFTEIEALAALAGVHAMHAGSGGVGGAEGAVWLVVFGDAAKLDRAQEVLNGVRGEPAFL